MIPKTNNEREVLVLLGRLRELDARLPQAYLSTLPFSTHYHRAHDFMVEVIRARWWHKAAIPVTKKRLAAVRRAITEYAGILERDPPREFGVTSEGVSRVEKR
jgi:hypothetical protein